MFEVLENNGQRGFVKTSLLNSICIAVTYLTMDSHVAHRKIFIDFFSLQLHLLQCGCYRAIYIAYTYYISTLSQLSFDQYSRAFIIIFFLFFSSLFIMSRCRLYTSEWDRYIDKNLYDELLVKLPIENLQ